MRRHINRTEDNAHSYKALKKYEKVTCDFCDKTFKNRFESIVHTASHIIIPLIKQSSLFCDICNSFIITQDDLNMHNLIKHPEVFIKKEEPISYEASPEMESPIVISYSEEISNDIKIPIRDRLQFEENNTSFNGILKDLVTECKVNLPICDPCDDGGAKCYKSSNFVSNGIPKQEVHIKVEKKQRLIDCLVLEDPLPDEIEHFGKYETEQNDSNSYAALVRPGIRLQFEENDTSFNGILKDLVTECKVNLPICDPCDDDEAICYEPSDLVSNGIPKQEVHIKIEKKRRLIDSLVLEDPLPDAIEHFGKYESEQNESNSFASLVTPGIFSCRYCLASFPTRFSLIQHEVVHMKISKGRPLLCLYCDKYIAGNHYNLNKHINKNHWKRRNITKKTEKCKICGLKYRKYRRHQRNYHIESVPQKDIVKKMKLLKCCDLCISFFRNTNTLKYVIKGTTKDELGVRHTCDLCGKLHFKLKIVQRHSENRTNNDRGIKRKTNEDRLKLIQKRFKKLNLLNK